MARWCGSGTSELTWSWPPWGCVRPRDGWLVRAWGWPATGASWSTGGDARTSRGSSHSGMRRRAGRIVRGRTGQAGHWTEALNAPAVVGPAVAAWAAGVRDPLTWRASAAEPAPDPIPYVFSDIAGRRLLTLGEPGAGRVISRESEPFPAPGPLPTDHERRPGATDEAWTAFSLDAQDRLVGLCTVGRPRDLAAARRAMLADPQEPPGSTRRRWPTPTPHRQRCSSGRAEAWAGRAT